MLSILGYLCVDTSVALIRTEPKSPTFHLYGQQRSGRTSADLGELRLLPLEILYETLRYVDLMSFMSFSMVNRSARDVVNSMTEYKLTRTHAASALEGLFRANLASWFTITDLFAAFCSRVCGVCNRFGGFFYLLGCSRCCLVCAESSWELSEIQTTDALVELGVHHSALKRLVPMMRSEARQFTIRLPPRRGCRSIVRLRDAVRVAGASNRVWHSCFASTHLLVRERRIDYRFLVLTQMPYLDNATGKLQHGISCKACKLSAFGRSIDSRWRCGPGASAVFTEEGFVEHCRTC